MKVENASAAHVASSFMSVHGGKGCRWDLTTDATNGYVHVHVTFLTVYAILFMYCLFVNFYFFYFCVLFFIFYFFIFYFSTG